MHQILLVAQVLIAIGVVGLVLLQQGKGADAGAAFGSGGAGSVFGSRGPATLLTRMTAILAAVFFVNSIALAYLAREVSTQGQSVVERYQDEGANQSAGEGFITLPAEEGGSGPADLPELPSTLEEEGTRGQ